MKFIESETLELKKSTSEIKEAVISIVSILNKNQHGELSFGIKNNGTVIGQNVTGKTLRDVSKSIADNIEPKIYPHISHIKTDRKSCIKVRFKGNDIPYKDGFREKKRVDCRDASSCPFHREMGQGYQAYTLKRAGYQI